jgi:hypothetical protein
MFLKRFDVALDHAFRLRVQERGARLAYSQVLQNFLYQRRFELTALVTN